MPKLYQINTKVFKSLFPINQYVYLKFLQYSSIFMDTTSLNCPYCTERYSLANPPRLLTMCGHTYCHKCIKKMITKKKDKAFKVKCPLDKKYIEVQKPNPTYFPKNIALIEILNKSEGGLFQSNQFLNVSISSYNNIKIGNDQENSKNESQEKIQIETHLCPVHAKPTDVYCLSDCQIICTDCALFSNHRNHSIKMLSQMISLQNQKRNQLLNIAKDKQRADLKFKDKQIQNEIFDLIDKKKGFIQKDISQFFINIKNLLDSKQNSILQQLDSKVYLTAETIRKRMTIQKDIIQSYEVWRQDINGLVQSGLSSSQDQQRIDKKLQNLIKNKFYQTKINEGKFIIQSISKQQEQFFNSIERVLDSLQFKENLKQFKNAINQISILSCNHEQQNISYPLLRLTQTVKPAIQTQNKISFFKDSKAASQQINGSKDSTFQMSVISHQSGSKLNKKQINFESQQEEQSLLDFDQKIQTNPLHQTQLSYNNGSKLSTTVSNMPCSAQVSQTKKNYKLSAKGDCVQGSSKKRGLSLSFRSSSTVINRTSSSTSKRSIKGFKYQSLIDQITNDQLDTVDLTGTEPKAEQITKILQAIDSSQKVKTLKLMRNKLDDEFVKKNFKYLLKVQRLNLAQNKFTQQTVSLVLYILKVSKNHQLKYLNLSQNRIIQRKNRKILDQFKNLSVTIVL